MGGERRAAREGLDEPRFELRAKLGEGGMGVVYRALDRSLGKEVALKRVRAEVDLSRAQQLKAEFRARSALQHRNLVQLYELVIDGEDCFLTMELVDGTNLASWVRSGTACSPPTEQPVTAETMREGRHDRAPASSPRPVRGGAAGRNRSRSRESEAEKLDAAGLARLRGAVSELCAGLAVLHESGIVHRDVTPANVRVTPEGRVVLLDFGLAAVVETQPGSRTVIAGTPRYMAPEQVRGEAVTPAADQYALGGILYELLTGHGAFEGTGRAVQVEKAAGDRPRPILAGASPDDDLAALAMALLDPDPNVRPPARAVIRRLAQDLPAAAPTFGVAAPIAFVGRAADVAALQGALDRVRLERRPLAMLIEGPSGIGKSTLVRRVLTDLSRRDPTALVLSSRCHPQETIPFKAVDAAMDALAAHAARLRYLGSFSPAMAHAAVRLFPALSSVRTLGRHPPPEATADDADLRAQGFETLRDLFGRLAARGPLVLWIDDVQWDDPDSVALIEALLRGRGAPPMLLLMSLRTESGESALVQRLLHPRGVVPLERRTLGPLGGDDVEQIATAFLGEDDARVARVVTQSTGNPFLACELARYLASVPPDSTMREDMPEVQVLVAARLEGLSPTERALLEVASLAVRPLTTTCALAAAHLGADARTAVMALRDALLLQQGTSAAGETIAPYHDKIAEATEHLLSAEERTRVHRALAEALEKHQPGDADALSVHWEGAGDAARAAVFAYRAAEHATATLAFGRAAELYEKAIGRGFDGVERAVLLERAAAAHANHGRAPAAASRYLDASRALGDDVTSARVRTLKRLAAEQYVKSGYVRHGWEVMRSVLEAASIPLPSSPTAATLGALARRLRFLVRRIDVDAIGDRHIPEAERARLEILWTASTSMSMVNVTLSDAFRTQHLGRILDVGDASSIARALAYEVALEVHVGGPLFDWHAARLLRHAGRLVARTGDPYDRGWLDLAVANQAFCAGRFADAITACRASERTFREQCSGVAWEISTVAAFLLTSLAMLGDLPALREAAERFTADAEGRGDLFGVAEAYGGECVLAWWSMGAGPLALARATDAAARQGAEAERWPEKTSRRGELTELMATVHMRLIEGDPWPAWRMMLAHWDGLKSALIPSLQFYRSWVRHGRARVALAAAASLGRGEVREGWSHDRLLDDVRRTQREMTRDTRPFGPPWAALIEAALAHADGRRDAALSALERAVAGFDGAGMALYREVARLRLAGLSGSTRDRDEAEGWLRAQGVPDPAALTDGLVPGFGQR
jgi:hypothetical protein